MSNTFPFESIYSIQGVLLAPFVSVGLMLFFLGFYILLFGIVVYFLLTRETMVNRKLHLGWMIILFVLSVAASVIEATSIIIEATLGFEASSTGNIDSLVGWENLTVGRTPHLVLIVFSGMLYLLANCIADAILLYRCYVIWGSTFHALTGVLLLVSFAINGLGFAGHITVFVALGQQQWDLYTKANDKIDVIYNFANPANTLLLTLLIASRIWWVTRDAREYMGSNVDRQYKRIISISIESGFLYSATLFANVGVVQSSSNLGFGLSLNPLVRLMVGIAPTLIFLHTILAVSDNAVPEVRMLSTLRFEEPPAVVSSSESETLENNSVFRHGAFIDGSKDVEAQKVERSETSGA